jgi:hypothetical protein
LGWLAVVHPTPDGRDRLVGVVVRSDLLRVFERTDGNLRDEILACLGTRFAPIDPTVVDVGVHEGVVTLSGHLPSMALARQLTELVERLEGAVAVNHDLTFDVRAPEDPR